MVLVRRRVIYDPGQPVVIRNYVWEALATLDKDLLAAEGIPAVIYTTRDGEVGPPMRAQLVVRREHAAEAIEILESMPESSDDPEEP